MAVAVAAAVAEMGMTMAYVVSVAGAGAVIMDIIVLVFVTAGVAMAMIVSSVTIILCLFPWILSCLWPSVAMAVDEAVPKNVDIGGVALGTAAETGDGIARGNNNIAYTN